MLYFNALVEKKKKIQNCTQNRYFMKLFGAVDRLLCSAILSPKVRNQSHLLIKNIFKRELCILFKCTILHHSYCCAVHITS